jgi:thiamine transporter
MNSSTEKKKMSDHDRLMRLVTSAVMIALAFVLSFFKFSEFPYGGSVTCFSMVPIVLLGIMYGKGWGLACGTINGVLQALQGAFGSSKAFAGLGTFEVILMCFLDYIAAFAVIGLAGMLISKAIKNNNAKKIAIMGSVGALIVSFLRYVIHIISGAILFGGYAEWFFSDVFVNSMGKWIMANTSGATLATVYSIIYNGLYMLPEIIITTAGTAILLSVPFIRSKILSANTSR